MKFQIAFKTDVGLVRDHNEDNFIISPDMANNIWAFEQEKEFEHNNNLLLAVADGMGGANAGEVASAMACESIRKNAAAIFEKSEKDDGLKRVISIANNEIFSHTEKNSNTRGMGTTLVVALVENNNAHISWLGDSRAYIFRKDKLARITKDHSYVQELVDAGKITDDQAFFHPDSNRITQVAGQGPGISPGYQQISLFTGDYLLLCTDGLCGMIQDHEIEMAFSEKKGQPIGELRDLLIRKALDAGGSDNVTVLLLHVLEGAQLLQTSSTIIPDNTISSDDRKFTNAIKPGEKTTHVSRFSFFKKNLVWVSFLAGVILTTLFILVYLYFTKDKPDPNPVKQEKNDSIITNENKDTITSEEKLKKETENKTKKTDTKSENNNTINKAPAKNNKIDLKNSNKKNTKETKPVIPDLNKPKAAKLDTGNTGVKEKTPENKPQEIEMIEPNFDSPQ